VPHRAFHTQKLNEKFDLGNLKLTFELTQKSDEWEFILVVDIQCHHECIVILLSWDHPLYYFPSLSLVLLPSWGTLSSITAQAALSVTYCASHFNHFGALLIQMLCISSVILEYC
jgi:hypothetical protein